MNMQHKGSNIAKRCPYFVAAIPVFIDRDKC